MGFFWSFLRINGFLPIKHLQQYLAHKHHSSIGCYDDCDDNDDHYVTLDGTMI